MTPVEVEGGIRALRPGNGLFLKAVHLETMQNYSAQLSAAVGVAVGSGVVYGFEAAFDATTSTLEILPGLAIDSVGEVIRSVSKLSMKVDPLELTGPDDFVVIELTRSSHSSGQEAVYGTVCDEPCSGGSSIQPFTDYGARLSLRVDSLPGLGSVLSRDRRNWAASAYFERERAAGDPWTVPPGSAQSLSGRPWASAPPAPPKRGVPIGVLLLVDGAIVLDVWTARRDLSVPPADNFWRGRLAMRPRSVFLAQMLQFEDEYQSAEPAALVVKEVSPSKLLPVLHSLDEFLTRINNRRLQSTLKEEIRLLESSSHETRYDVSLFGRGIHELPPAGFLQIDSWSDREDAERQVLALFAQAKVSVRFCSVRADAVAGAIEAAQHLDRIPLDGLKGVPAVDILVPTEPADLAGLVATAYPWVAFVRRTVHECEQPIVEVKRDEVDVYLFASESQEPVSLDLLKEPETVLEKATRFGTLSFPHGEWEFPGELSELDVAVKLRDVVGHQRLIELIAVTRQVDSTPLASTRTALFAASLDRGAAPPPVRTIVADFPDAIVVVIDPKGQ
jgi:hypothetical protein